MKIINKILKEKLKGKQVEENRYEEEERRQYKDIIRGLLMKDRALMQDDLEQRDNGEDEIEEIKDHMKEYYSEKQTLKEREIEAPIK